MSLFYNTIYIVLLVNIFTKAVFISSNYVYYIRFLFKNVHFYKQPFCCMLKMILPYLLNRWFYYEYLFSWMSRNVSCVFIPFWWDSIAIDMHLSNLFLHAFWSVSPFKVYILQCCRKVFISVLIFLNWSKLFFNFYKVKMTYSFYCIIL